MGCSKSLDGRLRGAERTGLHQLPHATSYEERQPWSPLTIQELTPQLFVGSNQSVLIRRHSSARGRCAQRRFFSRPSCRSMLRGCTCRLKFCFTASAN
jgi:hypothetical protein